MSRRRARPTLDELGELYSVADTGRKAGGVSVWTVRRWLSKGVPVNGQLVKLEKTKIGGRTMVTAASLARFIHECNP